MGNFYHSTYQRLCLSVILPFLLFGLSVPAYSQLSGNYTIGSGGNYATFNDAVSALNNEGISGPVTFSVLNGIYTEQLVLNSITGASETNTITFQSQSGNAADVELRFNSGSGAIYTINLNGASHLRFKNIGLRSINATNSRILTGTGIINDLIVENVVFTAPNTSSTLNSRALIYMELESSLNLQFLRNSFTGGSTAMILIGSNDINNPAVGILISENTFRSNQFGAMELSRLLAPNIEENDVLINSSAGASTSLILTESRGAVQILKNKFIGSTLHGMRLTDVVNTSGTKSLVANNFVAGTSSGNIHLVRLDLISQLNFYHNSLNNYGFGHGIYFAGLSGSGVSIVNNLIKTGAGLVLDIASAAGLESLVNLDFNGYFNTGSNLVRTGSGFPTTEYLTLNSWQSASGSFEQNSLFGNPFFISDTELRPQSPVFAEAGVTVPEVTLDIDGETRGPNPSIGADEYIGIPLVPLAGTYTIDFNGSGDRNFTSIMDAAEALNLNGVSAPVIFQLATRTYSEQVELGNIEGSSTVNTITFESASGINTDVVISRTPSSIKNFVWSLNNTSHLRIRNLTISVNGTSTTVGRNLVGVGSINDFKAENVRFLGGNMSGTNANRTNVYFVLQDSENINFNNCEFRGGFWGLYITRASIESIVSGVTVRGNTVRNTNSTGIGLSGFSDVIIEENDVLLTTTVTGSRSINLGNITGNIQVTSNKFNGGAGAAGSFQILTATSQSKGLIANNFFSTDAALSVDLGNLTHINFYNNSILNTGTGLGIQSGGGLAGVEGLRVINNLIKTGSGAAIRIFNSEPIETWDYNGYYTIGAALGVLVSTEIGSLEEWQTASGFDANTLIFDPIFNSDNDLTSTAPAYANSGLTVPEVTVDINGAERKSTPSRGAVEFDASPVSPMVGEYTINSSGGGERNFSDFGAAVFALQSNSVAGAVIFKVANGTYNEQIVIPAILGASSTNTIRFESQSGNSNDVILQWAGVSTAANYVVRFDNAKHIYFKDMTLATASSSGSTDQRVLEAYNTISNLTIENCQILGNDNAGTSLSRAVVFFNPISADDIRFINNKIQGGSSGIYFRLTDLSTPLTNLHIEGNEITSWDLGGINISPIYGAKIKRNTIHTLSTRPSRGAVILNIIHNGLEFEGNRIYGARAEFTNGISNSVETPVLITNNFFTNTNTSAALLISNTSHTQIYHNNVLGTETTGPALEYSGGSSSVGNKIKNNIFKSNTGYAIRVTNANGLEEINHNGYFTSGASLARWLSTDAADLVAWYTLTGGIDFNSWNVDPVFISDETLYTTEDAYKGTGIFLPSVTVDIDGAVRNQPPSIGANEVSEEDPCLTVNCPPGQACFQGACLFNIVQVSGIVVDFDTKEPLSGVRVSVGEVEVFTDATGAYSLDVTALTTLTFGLTGYESNEVVVQAEAGSQSLNIELVSQCSGVECPLGQACFQGTCFPAAFSVSGTVRDADTNEPIAGVLVSSPTSAESEVLTAENGSYSITVTYEGIITFSKEGYELFTSNPILEAISGLDVVLEPIEDLCSITTCLIGYECTFGTCFPIPYTIQGTVRNVATNDPIAGVLVSSSTLNGLVEVFTDENGSYSITVTYEGIITFSKEGYELFTSNPILEATSGLDVMLQPSIDLCAEVECPTGFSCTLGTCFEDTYVVSGIIRSSVDNSVISNVKVTRIPEREVDVPVFTDANGFFSIQVNYNDQIRVEKELFDEFTSAPIFQNNENYNITLIRNCEGHYCPIGQSCFQGVCYLNCSLDQDCPEGTKCFDGRCVPLDDIFVSGYVRDMDSSEPLADVSVLGEIPGLFIRTTSGPNGYYALYLKEGSTVTFNKDNYEEFTLGPIELGQTDFDVYLQFNPCEGVFCPVGQTCVGGECKLACSQDMDCPPGTVCAGGACLTFDELCLNTQCPQGTVCLNGRCITEEDLCYNKTCPEGTYCLDGNCIVVNDPFLTIAGTVRDKITGNVIPNIEIEVGDNYKTVFGRSDGTYTATVPFGFNLNFSKWDYVEFDSPPMSVSRSSYEVELYKNWCLIHSCQPGQVCVNGRCETIFYTISGMVRDELTNEPIANAIVKTAGASTTTDEAGEYTIEVILDNAIQFVKDGYATLQSPIITAENPSYDVLLGPDLCLGISCPPGFVCKDGDCVADPCAGIVCQPGEICFNGFCLAQPDLTIFGTVKDINTGSPIAASAVVKSSPTLVDYNGYFIVQVPYGEQILFIANGYEWEYSPFLFEDFQVLEVFMTPDGVCENVICPDGKICANGVCVDPCENISCPPGTICYSGECIIVACETSLTTLQITPEIGTSETEFTFTISYKDLGNYSPKNGYPRLALQAQNADLDNPVPTLYVEMSELDPSDGNFTDGKLYTANVSGLADNTAWKAHVETENTLDCRVETQPINAPNVSINNLDIAIFANNISFSNDNPLENETITIFARVRNLSDFPAENFVVSAYDGENQIFSTTVNLLQAGENVNLSWPYSFEEAGFYPIKVVIDEDNTLEEINELNNFAIRPVLVGNYVLPGGIEVNASLNTTTAYVNSVVTVSGTAMYFGIDEGVSPNVVGANVTLNYESGSTQTTTNSSGNFSGNIKMPDIPGIYTFTGSVTDFTLSAEIPSFQVEVIPYPEKADLKTDLVVNQTEAFADEEVSGTATVTNLGELTAINFIFRVESCEGIIENYPVTSLAPGESLSFDFITSISNKTGSCLNKNNCSIIATADVTNVVDDKTRNNNSTRKSLTIYPELPDLTPSNSSISGSSTMDAPFELTVRVDNIGGVAVSQDFSVNIYLNDELVDSRQFDFLDKCSQLSYPVTLEFENLEDYEISIKVDEPIGSGVIQESDEDNNEITRTVSYKAPLEPMANLYITNTFLSVDPVLPEAGENFLINAKIKNNGNAAVVQDIEMNFRIEENGVFRNDIVVIPGGLEVGAEITAQFGTSLVQNGNHGVLVEIDPNKLIQETSKFDNKAGMPLCVDLVAAQSGPVWSGNFFVDSQQNLSGRVKNTGLFTAFNVRVDFFLDGTEIGNVIIPELKPSFGSLGQAVSIPYVFREVGTFKLEMTVDRNDIYLECNEANNSIDREIKVRDRQPDLRIVPEFLSPTKLNPEPNEEIELFVSFENIGIAGAQPFKIRVTIDDVPLGNDILVGGLAAGQLSTVPVEVPYSSPTAGIKVMKGIIDVDQESDDINYVNNEATRSLVVGQAPNLFFSKINFSSYCPEVGESIEILVDIENEGDLGADAEVHFYYVTESDTIPIDAVKVFVDLQSTISTSINWTVINSEYGILAMIKNSNPQEYNDLDNLIFGEFKDVNPPIIKTKNITVNLDENGEAFIKPEDVDDGSYDEECGIAELSLDTDRLDCTAAGSTVLITFTAKDFAGNEASAEVEVLVVDKIAPSISSSGDQEVNVETGLCSAIVEVSASASDNCSVGDPVGERSDGLPLTDPYPVGITTITWNVIDANGNDAASVAQTVTVTDNEIPVITTNGDKSINAEPGLCSAIVVVSASASDNCSVGNPIGIRSDGLPLSDPYPVGVTKITWDVSDGIGNAATSVEQSVTVTDTEFPVIKIKENIVVNLGANGGGSLSVEMVNDGSTDNCGIESLVLSRTSFTCTHIGEQLINLTAKDAAGNETVQQFTISVRDNLPPTVVGRGVEIFLNESGAATLTASQVDGGSTDNCSIESVSVNKTSFDCSELGDNEVILTVKDASGNESAVSVTVKVTDNTPPVILKVPEDMLVYAGATTGYTLPDFITSSITEDNCETVEFTQSPAAGSTLASNQNHTITLTAKDASGNITTATFTITVEALQVVTVESLEMLKVNWNTPFNTLTLPANVQVTLNNGETVSMNVVWQTSSYEPLVAGVYSLVGNLTLTDEITNPEQVQASLMVLIREKPLPQDIILNITNQNINPNIPIGEFATIDTNDDIHVYELANGSSDNSYFILEGNVLKWDPTKKVAGKKDFTIEVSTTDRAGNTIIKVFNLTFVSRRLTEIEVLNTFTPNGDGVNDTWGVPDLFGFDEVSISVVDRAGRIVFRTTDPRVRWDGTFEGRILPVNAYVYVIETKDPKEVRSGVINLLIK